MIQRNSQVSSSMEVSFHAWRKNSSTAVGWLEVCKMPVQWQSDMSFIKEELRFFNTLVNKCFLSLLETENNVSIKMVLNELRETETQQRCLSQKISRHLRHMHELMAENPFSYDSQTFNEEHTTLERELIDFSKYFRMMKRKIFEITERAEALWG